MARSRYNWSGRHEPEAPKVDKPTPSQCFLASNCSSSMSLKLKADSEIRLCLRRLQRHTSSKRESESSVSCGNSQARQRRALVYSDERQDFPKNTEGKRRGYGLPPNVVSFTRKAKSYLGECAAAIERKMPGASLFLTGTLAGSTPEAIKGFSDWSGLIIERLTQWLRDVAPGAMWCWVWEFQERGALHVHGLVAVYSKKLRRKVKRGFAKYWKHLLHSLSDDTGIDFFARGNGGTWRRTDRVVRATASVVRKSVRAYLAKYLSKSRSKQGSFSPAGGTLPMSPLRWWGCNVSTRRAVASFRAAWVSGVQDLRWVRDKFERVGGILVSGAKWCAFFDNPYAPGDRTLIVRAGDNESRLLFDYVVRRMDALWEVPQ